MRVTALGLVVALTLAACSADDAPSDGALPTTAAAEPSTEADVCETAAASIGALDPPVDLDGVRAGAEAIVASTTPAALGDDADPRLLAALAAVGDGARLLAEASASGDPAAMTDAAATLDSAYDELDQVAAALELSACGSESWGRQVVIAAVDLSGSGG